MTDPTEKKRTRREISVDERSLDLADHFLQDETHTEGDRWDLAKVIQQAVEDWFDALQR